MLALQLEITEEINQSLKIKSGLFIRSYCYCFKKCNISPFLYL